MLIGRRSKQRKYDEITLLHLIGAIMIICCHIFQKEQKWILGEIFITGVPLFVFVSGFLSGLKDKTDINWIKKRAVRILVPFYLWVVPCLLVIWLSDHRQVNLSQLLFLLTNTQGLNYFIWKFNKYGAVQGMGHLWFTTEIMICYILTPVIIWGISKIKDISKKRIIFIFTVFIIIVQPLLTEFGMQPSYLITFILGVIVAQKGIEITRPLFIKLTIVCTVVTILRLILMKLCDGTIYYDRYLVQVSSTVIGIWIVCLVFFVSSEQGILIKKIAENPVIAYLSEISFEIYLVHMLFFNGKWQIFNYVQNKFYAYTIAILLSLIFAIVLHILSRHIIIKLFNPKEIKNVI